MSWWSKSGDKRVWMSARGKPWVNCWHYKFEKIIFKWKKKTYNNITPDSIPFPNNTWIEAFDNEVGSFMSTTSCLIDITIQIIWFCLASGNQLTSMNIRWRHRNVLRTPALNNSRQPNLFRIISNIRSQTVNHPPEMTIGAANNLWHSHSWSKRRKYSGKAHVVNLPAKCLNSGCFRWRLSAFNKVLRLTIMTEANTKTHS